MLEIRKHSGFEYTLFEKPYNAKLSGRYEEIMIGLDKEGSSPDHVHYARRGDNIVVIGKMFIYDSKQFVIIHPDCGIGWIFEREFERIDDD